MKESFTYADAGVDIDKANKLVDIIGEIAKQTARPGVMSDIGGFGGLFSLNLANLDKPVLTFFQKEYHPHSLLKQDFKILL